MISWIVTLLGLMAGMDYCGAHDHWWLFGLFLGMGITFIGSHVLG